MGTMSFKKQYSLGLYPLEKEKKVEELHYKTQEVDPYFFSLKMNLKPTRYIRVSKIQSKPTESNPIQFFQIFFDLLDSLLKNRKILDRF